MVIRIGTGATEETLVMSRSNMPTLGKRYGSWQFRVLVPLVFVIVSFAIGIFVSSGSATAVPESQPQVPSAD